MLELFLSKKLENNNTYPVWNWSISELTSWETHKWQDSQIGWPFGCNWHLSFFYLIKKENSTLSGFLSSSLFTFPWTHWCICNWLWVFLLLDGFHDVFLSRLIYLGVIHAFTTFRPWLGSNWHLLLMPPSGHYITLVLYTLLAGKFDCSHLVECAEESHGFRGNLTPNVSQTSLWL